jgi:hypothetical protein
MKKLLLFLFLLPVFAFAQTINYNGTQWNNQTITLPAGQTYTGGYIGGMTANFVLDLNDANFTGTLTIGPGAHVTIKRGHWNNVINVSCLFFQGNQAYFTESDCTFINCGTVHDANDNGAIYDGTTASLKWSFCTFTRDTVLRSGLFIQGTYASGYKPISYMDTTLITYCQFISTKSNGTEVRGTFLRMGFKNNYILYTDNNGVNNVLGDVGVLYISGSVVCVNNYMRGGRGYISREWHMGRDNTLAVSWYVNNIRLGTNTYGFVDTRSDIKDSSFSRRGGFIYVINNSCANQGDVINFWSPVDVAGELTASTAPNLRVIVKYNLGVNFTLRGKTPMVADQSNGTWLNTDSSNNIYYASQSGQSIIDTITGAKTNLVPSNVGANLVAGNAPPSLSVYPAGTTTITAPTNSINFTSSASDIDGTVVSYQWSKISGPGTVTFSSATSASTNALFSSLGTYVVRINVTDNSGNQTNQDETVIYQNPTNQKPIVTVNQVNPNAVYLPTNYVLIQSTAQDPDGTIVSDVWTVKSTPAGAASPGSTGSGDNITFTGLVAGSYVFTRTATDNNGAVGFADVMIQVVAQVNVNSNLLILQGGGGKIIFK